MRGVALPSGESTFNALFYTYQRGARIRGLEFCLSREEFRTLTKGRCFYCDVEPSRLRKHTSGSKGAYVFNGVDRFDNRLGYTPENSRTCCANCNKAKNALPAGEFIAWAIRAHIHIQSAKETAP